MIRFMRFLFKSLVTATFAIVAVHFIRVVNIGFAVLRHFKGYGKLNTRIEVPECLSYRQVTAKQRLDKELYALLCSLLRASCPDTSSGKPYLQQQALHP